MKLTVVSKRGKEATIALLGPGVAIGVSVHSAAGAEAAARAGADLVLAGSVFATPSKAGLVMRRVRS